MTARRAGLLGTTLAILLWAATRDASAATSFPNDPFLAAGDQWGLTGAPASIQAPAAWCVSAGAGALVADVDTGADFSHPDLAGKLVPGAQFLGGTAAYPYENGGQPTGTGQGAVADDVGHGSMTAGIIAANTNNGAGIAAVAPAARILVVKVLQSDGQGGGTGFDSDVANGIRWAVDHGAHVINVSIGPGLGVDLTVNSDIPDALHYAAVNNVAVAVASGNSSLPAASYQGVQRDALLVGALRPDASVASYSNSGVGVSIYAPGGTGEPQGTDQTTAMHNDIVSTNLRGTYAAEAGTSFATPHVAGVLALLRATGMDAASARSRVVATAVSRNGHNDLDAAVALGATGTCSASGGSAPPAGHASSGRPAGPGRAQPPKPAPAAHPATAAPSAVAVASAPSGTPSAAAVPATGAPDAPAGSSGMGGRVLVMAAVVGGSGIVAGGGASAFALIRRRRLG